MKTIYEYLDEAKEITGSDGKTAEYLGVSRQAVSNYRNKGTMNIECQAKLADLLDEDFKQIVAAAEIAKHPENAGYWLSMDSGECHVVTQYFWIS